MLTLQKREGIKGSSIKSTIINVNKNKMADVRAEASGPWNEWSYPTCTSRTTKYRILGLEPILA